jgi:beta-glucosidase
LSETDRAAAARAFPRGFLWGAATSAYQIEGGVREGGRGESIWDRFGAVPGNITDGSNADVACDHYHRWKGDVDLLRWLGVGAYRFSVAWPRVMPDGVGAVNEPGLDFYDALVDALVAAGIRPFVTLYHWDLPQAVQDRGGWGVRDTADAFAEYAAAVARRLGDRVRHWITHNEPWVVATGGHEDGVHAPGHRDPALALRAAHHLLLSHARAMEAVRGTVPGAEAGITLNLAPIWPASSGEADREAARRQDGSFNRWYLDPLFRGRYPDDAIADRVRRGHLAGPELPFVQAGDLEAIAGPLDFLGVNYYSRWVVGAGEGGEPVLTSPVPKEELTDMEWEVFPQGLSDLLIRLQREYRPPAIYITENGAAYGDGPDAEGRIADTRRVAYLSGHLAAARRAIEAGVPLRGYFAWSLLDNFEWTGGYAKRFGLYWVDYASQQRLPKDSAFWYRDVVAGNGEMENTV